MKIGDRVKINIDVISNSGGLDGLEFTASGKNHWETINKNPEVIYTIVNIEGNINCPYRLDGEISETSFAEDELILV